MITNALIKTIFHAAYMERWNDKIRPMPLVEFDKQAHKMIIAYYLGKFEEDKKGFNWQEIIEGGIFEFLQRIVLTDIKPPIFYRIKRDAEKYKKLNEHVFNELKDSISCLGEEFCEKFRHYFLDVDNTLNKKILSAAHMYSSNWEFGIIKHANPYGYDIEIINKDFEEKLESFYELEGMKRLVLYNSDKKFIDLCGQLRFQSRWATNLHRIPKTSVLGHSLFVAIFAYLFSTETKACPKRCFNNFFTGLFHDLPEVLTRDIISPIKSAVAGLKDLISECERDLMEEILYPLIPEKLRPEIHTFTENEFGTIVTVNNTIKATTSNEINLKYNNDVFNPRDGQIVKAVDELSAYTEAAVALENGCDNEEFESAKNKITDKYLKIGKIGGIDFGDLYGQFE